MEGLGIVFKDVRQLLIDRGIGIYERRSSSFGYNNLPNKIYLVVRGPVFLPDKVAKENVVSAFTTKAEALASLERLAQAQFNGESEKQPEPPPQPQGKEIGGHRASSMQRGNGILYSSKKREGYDPRDYNGVVVTTDTSRAYWCSAWHRRVNGRAVLEVQLSPKV
jgi:hypothetical protein